MADEEIIAFIDEYVKSVKQQPASATHVRRFIVDVEDVGYFFGSTLREAIGKANDALYEANS